MQRKAKMAYTSRQVSIKERKKPSLGLPAAPQTMVVWILGSGIMHIRNVLPIRAVEQQRQKSGYYRVERWPNG